MAMVTRRESDGLLAKKETITWLIISLISTKTYLRTFGTMAGDRERAKYVKFT